MTERVSQQPTLPDIEVQVPESQRRPSSLVTRAAGATHGGRVRATNQDQFVIATLTGALHIEQSSFPQAQIRYGGPAGHLFAVADGMGGHGGGEQASVLAMGAVESFLLGALGFMGRASEEEASVIGELKDVLQYANTVVTAKGHTRPELARMGTTLTVGYTLGDKLYLAHAGDSRCYLYRGSTLSQLTRDHTLVNEMVAAGIITTNDAQRHHLRHMITNAVGGGMERVMPEVRKVDLQTGDVLLFCTDGLTEVVEPMVIDWILSNERDPEKACEDLVSAALEAGGPDNVTALVVSVTHAKRPDDPHCADPGARHSRGHPGPRGEKAS